MAKVEIATTVTGNGDVIIPHAFTKDIPVGSIIRVVILWEEEREPGQPKAGEESLTAFTARIQGRPLSPAYIPSVDKILIEDWANLPEEVEEGFDPDDWNRDWDELEALVVSSGDCGSTIYNQSKGSVK